MIKSLLKKEFKIDTTRDVGLDLLRVIALLLMVSIHYARAIPTMDMLGEILKFIGESAPAFFFFAFGVTLNIFLKKPINERIIRLILFFYVAMSHNIYTCFVFNFNRGTIFVTEFLFFLWLCQVIFFIIEFQRERSYIFYISFFLAFFAVISMTKLGQIDQIFNYLIQGPFPIFPWIAFVLFGFIYSRSINELASNKPIFALLFLFVILVTAFPLLFFKEHGMSLFLLNKWPLSAGYIFVFGVLSIFIIKLFNNKIIKNIFYKMKIVISIIQFVSRNLLLGTVSHYAIYLIPLSLNPKIYSPSFINKHPNIIMISGSLMIILMLVILMITIILLWNIIKNSNLIKFLTNNIFIVGLIIILLSSICYIYVKFLIPVNPSVVEALSKIMIITMVFFALEMHENRIIRANYTEPGK